MSIVDDNQDDVCWICLGPNKNTNRRNTAIGLVKIFKNNETWLKCKCSLGAHEHCLKSFALYSTKNGNAPLMNPYFVTRKNIDSAMTLDEATQMVHLETQVLKYADGHPESGRYVETAIDTLDDLFYSEYHERNGKLYKYFVKAFEKFWFPNPFMSSAFYSIQCPQCKIPMILKRRAFNYEYFRPVINMANLTVIGMATVTALTYVAQDVLLKFAEYVTRYGKYCMDILIPASTIKTRSTAFKGILTEDENNIMSIADYFIFSVAVLTNASSGWTSNTSLGSITSKLFGDQKSIWFGALTSITYFLTVHSETQYRYLALYSIAAIINKLFFSFALNPLYKKWRLLYDPLYFEVDSDMEQEENYSFNSKGRFPWISNAYQWLKKKLSVAHDYLTNDYRPSGEASLLINILEICFWPNVGCYINNNFLLKSVRFRTFTNNFATTPDDALFLGNLIGVSLYYFSKLVVGCVLQFYEYKVMQDAQVATYESEKMTRWDVETNGKLFALITGIPDQDSSFPYTHLFKKHFMTENERITFPDNPSYSVFKRNMEFLLLYNLRNTIDRTI